MAVALLVLAASCSDAPPAGQVEVPEVTGPAPAAVPPNRLGIKWDWSRVNSFAPYLGQMSGGTTFFELVWCEVQPQRGADLRWEASDAVVAGATKLGYTLALKIRTGTCWVTDGRGSEPRGDRGKTASAPPADEAAYDGFVKAAVARYAARGVHLWAIENEVNAANSWAGTADAYEGLARRAAAAIRSADPEAMIADFGLSSTGWGTAVAADLLEQGRDADAVAAWTQWFAARRGRAAFPPVSAASELREALAGSQTERNLEMFEVATRLAADKVVDITQVHFYEAPENVPALVELFKRRFPATGRMEAWEVGRFERLGLTDSALADRALQADDALKTVASLLAGGAQRVMWLPAAVNPEGRNPDEPRAGLMDPDGTVRPAGAALAALVAATALENQVTPLPAASRLEGVVFGPPTGPAVLVAWASGEAVRLATSGVVLRLGPPTVADGVIDIGGSPVVLEVAAGTAAALALGTA